MVASLRKSDSIAEQALGAFLDEHFYETLHKRDAGFEYERVHDRKRQLKGMDVIVNYHGNRGSARKVAHFGSWPSMER